MRITLFCFPHGFSSPLLSKHGYCQDMSSPWVVGTCLVVCTGAGPAQSIHAAATDSSHDSAPAGSCYLTRITALAKTSHTRCLPYRLMHYLNKKAFIYLILHFDFMSCSSSEWLFQLELIIVLIFPSKLSHIMLRSKKQSHYDVYCRNV